MNWGHWIVWGFTSTIVLTTIFALTQGLGMTRMSIPIMLGTMVTRDRDRAGIYGILLHAAIGWVLSLLYVLAFEARGAATWWFGGLLGLLRRQLHGHARRCRRLRRHLQRNVLGHLFRHEHRRQLCRLLRRHVSGQL